MGRKKTWQEKLHDDKGLPSVVTLDGAMAERWHARTMVIPAPVEVDALMRSVPRGKVITLDMIRRRLAVHHGTDTACPLTTVSLRGLPRTRRRRRPHRVQATSPLTGGPSRRAVRSIRNILGALPSSRLFLRPRGISSLREQNHGLPASGTSSWHSWIRGGRPASVGRQGLFAPRGMPHAVHPAWHRDSPCTRRRCQIRVSRHTVGHRIRCKRPQCRRRPHGIRSIAPPQGRGPCLPTTIRWQWPPAPPRPLSASRGMPDSGRMQRRSIR